MNIEISVVIPVYNAEATIRETLESVSMQSFKNIEVLVINDGSTDESKDLIRKWRDAQSFPVGLISQRNSGQAAARNKGAAAAKADWIAFLDSDDIWEPEKLEVMHGYTLNAPADVFYHQIKAFGTRQNRTRRAYQLRSLKDLLMKGNPVAPSAVLIRKEVLREFPFDENPNFKGVEDFHLWIRLLQVGKKFRYVKKPLARYREAGGISSKLEEHLERVFQVLQHFYKKGYFSQKELAIAKRRKYMEAARFYQKRKDFSKAERFYQAADFKSVKISGLRLLNFLGVRI